MKFNPSTLFDINIIWDEKGDYSIDIAPSKVMLRYCTDRLNETHTKSKELKEADIIKDLTLYISEYIKKSIN